MPKRTNSEDENISISPSIKEDIENIKETESSISISPAMKEDTNNICNSEDYKPHFRED